MSGRAKSVKRSELSNGLDTALYKNIPLPFCVRMFQWHALDRTEQAKYYDMARKEKELHMQLYPGWSARDNYAIHSKKKKRKREPHTPDNRGRPFTHVM